MSTHNEGTHASVPEAIWMPGGKSPSVYAGTPMEMVKRMAKEMDPSLLPREAIQIVTVALRYHRGVQLRLAWDKGDAALAEDFVRQLVRTAIARELPSA